MLKAELGYFKDHKLLIVVILAIALIPTIYAVTFLSSMWDPYGRTDQLPIAVVNDDHSASMSGKTLHVGDDLTKQLKDSNGFDFQFVSDHQAQQGLDSGKYYAIYKIPANFSKKRHHPTDGSPPTDEIELGDQLRKELYRRQNVCEWRRFSTNPP
ncbi:YhgE/Pip domain-containing protein [Secundilactobacillus kimchicus]|uniref:YhgE/Pip domain-containing protein n=1 Tax=Secundilactobacillus kimchicus TaxID=528209 RepID=UPI0006D1472C|nr:YhgE/Pip family protein [Secundilactobacillus kimchicus]